MDEPEDPNEETGQRASPLPAVLFVLAAGFVVTLLLGAWHTRDGGDLPIWLVKLDLCLAGILVLVFLGALTGAGPAPAERREPEAWLCQHCLKPYVPGAHFCPRCGAPLTWFSGTGKYERIHAQAWILGKAARYPSRALHLVGLLFLVGPTVLGLVAAVLLGGLLDDHDASFLTSVLAMSLASAQWWIHLALFVMCIRNWCRRLRGEPPRVPEIEYGAPPSFTYDVEWALPEFEEDPDGGGADVTPAAG